MIDILSGVNDIKKFFENAEDIEEYELEIFQKFGVDGYDIYDRIADYLYDIIDVCDYETGHTFNENLTEKDIEAIKPLFIGIFSEKEWNKIKKHE